jgi:hypothetical protein
MHSENETLIYAKITSIPGNGDNEIPQRELIWPRNGDAIAFVPYQCGRVVNFSLRKRHENKFPFMSLFFVS